MTVTMVLSAAFGYLLGSIPFGLILTRLAGLGDIRSIGSGNIGATNVLRTGNKGLAALTLVLDAMKGTAAVVLAGPVTVAIAQLGLGGIGGPEQGGTSVEHWLAALFLASMVAGVGAFFGHCFPVWLGFRGGKGVATYIGVLIGLAWPVALVFCGIWLAAAVVTRYSSASALAASMATPVIAWLAGEPHSAFASGLMSLLLIWRHRANIDRLLKGEEPRIGAKSKA